MGRRSVLERLEQEAELRLRVLVAEAERAEDPRLDVGAVDPDRAARDLVAVEREVVGEGAHGRGIALEALEIGRVGRREGMVRRDEAPLVAGLEEREVGDPAEAPLGLGDEAQLAGDV